MNSFAEHNDPVHILVVDDDDRIRELLKRYLQENGYHVSVAPDGQNARELLTSLEFDLIILDVMMPGLSGFELTEKIRAASNMPILLLSARGLTEDRIEGLERGANDYLSKPFEPRELILRVNNLLRRSHRPTGSGDAELTFGECRFNPSLGALYRNEDLIKLTSAELSLLRALSKKPGEAISREALAEQTGAGMERSIDVQVTRLRKKIEQDPRTPIYLQTVRGIGYTLMAD